MRKTFVSSGTSLVLEAESSELLVELPPDLRVEVPTGWVVELSEKNHILSLKPFVEVPQAV